MRKRLLKKSRLLQSLLAAVTVAGMAIIPGMSALAAKGDVVFYGNANGSGSVVCQIVEEGDQSNCPYVARIYGTGKMGDYRTVSTDYDRTNAPWKDLLAKIYRVEICENVTEVGQYAFAQGGTYSANIKELVLADTVTKIGKGAFKNQRSIQDIQFSQNLVNIGPLAFGANPIQSYTFPESLKIIGERAFEGGYNLNNLSFPDGLEDIYDGAFQNCSGMRIVALSSGMTTVRPRTFKGCSKLTAVLIPSGITTIQEDAFLDTDIRDIYYGGNETQWSNLMLNTASGNDRLKSATVHYGLSDAFEIRQTTPVVGQSVYLDFTTDYTQFWRMQGFTVQWQRSATGTSDWENITVEPDATRGTSRYKVKDADVGYYIRACVKKSGFKFPGYTEPLKVYDGISLDNFSDANLRNYMKETYDKDGNNILSAADINKIHTLNIGNMKIESLQGIEKLWRLEFLYANRNKFSTANLNGLENLSLVDVSDNTNLKRLNLYGTGSIRELYVEDTTLESLDLSGNPYISKLSLYRSKINKIDIHMCSDLVDAALHGKETDYSYYTQYKTDRGQLDLTYQTPLVAPLTQQYFPGAPLQMMLLGQAFDWDQDKKLSMTEAKDVKNLVLDDEEGNLTTLTGIEYFPNLEYLSASNCRISEVDLSGNTKLKTVYLGGNELQSLDVSMLTDMELLDVSYNSELGVLDTGKNTKLAELRCEDCGLTELDLSGIPNLCELYCGENAITQLNTGVLPKLEALYCGDAPLTKLDLSRNKKLKKLYVPCTGLSSLDVSVCPGLEYLCCYGTGIKELDISKNECLSEAYAGKCTAGKDSDSGITYNYYTTTKNNRWQMSVDTNVKIRAVKTGTWKKDKKGWWYRYSDGSYPVNQWVKIDGGWYYFNKDGYMHTGWLKYSGKWYYLNPKTGIMTTGWKKIDGSWYYFKTSGIMAANEYCKGYWLNKDGTCTYTAKASWKKDANGWYYIDTKGWYGKNCTLKIDDVKYIFDEKGYVIE